MMNNKRRKFLSNLFGEEHALFAPEEMLVFGADASRLSDSPFAVVRPESREQVEELLAWADSERVPVFTRSAGTNVVGSAVPRGGGVVLSMLRMQRIREIHEGDFVAVVEPGVITAELQAEAKEKRLFYPPDPASLKISTIGGNVATCAGGMRALKYGVTRDFVLGLEAVLPGGTVLATGSRCHKNVVGLDLVRLFTGSEGTLGVMTEITLKLLPLPEASASLMAGFADLDDLMGAARAVFAAGLLPAAMEFMDAGTLEAVAGVAEAPWDETTRAALLFRLDGSEAAVRAETGQLESLLAAASPHFLEKGVDAQGEERLWELRRMVSPALYNLAPDKLNDDVTVPRSRIPEAVRGYQAIGERLGLRVVCFGHLGDGNIHVDFMFDAARPEQLEAARRAKREQFELTLSLGGTISGEHGVGLSKLAYLDMQLSPAEREMMRRIKAAFDPNSIMNPGKAY